MKTLFVFTINQTLSQMISNSVMIRNGNKNVKVRAEGIMQMHIQVKTATFQPDIM